MKERQSKLGDGGNEVLGDGAIPFSPASFGSGLDVEIDISGGPPGISMPREPVDDSRTSIKDRKSGVDTVGCVGPDIDSGPGTFSRGVTPGFMQRMALGPVRLVSTSLLTSSRSPISLLALLICRLSYTTHYAGAKLRSPLHIENLREEDEVVKSWRYLKAVLVRRPSPTMTAELGDVAWLIRQKRKSRADITSSARGRRAAIIPRLMALSPHI